MDWSRDPRFDLYKLTPGTWHAAVTHDSSGQWLAIISWGHKIAFYQQFDLLQPAQSWCEYMIGDIDTVRALN